jgi:hypothetical protein
MPRRLIHTEFGSATDRFTQCLLFVFHSFAESSPEFRQFVPVENRQNNQHKNK